MPLPLPQTPKLPWFGIESFGSCPCQVVDVPQIEYEDKVVEVPVQKHVQVATGQTLGSWEPVGRSGNEMLYHLKYASMIFQVPCRFTGHLAEESCRSFMILWCPS
jgi:hypothetical protein